MIEDLFNSLNHSLICAEASVLALKSAIKELNTESQEIEITSIICVKKNYSDAIYPADNILPITIEMTKRRGKYKLIDGYRRLQAALLMGHSTVPARITYGP